MTIQWFVVEDPTRRTVGYEWYRDIPGTSVGTLVFMQREHPGDTWGPPKTVRQAILLADARTFCLGEGFKVEVAAS